MPEAVLLIDDDAEFRNLARRVLENAGITVVGEAATAADGLAAVRDLRPDAVLLDVGLPDRDGVSLAAEITTLHGAPRVVLTSADHEATAGRDLAVAGAEGFVAKDQLPDEGLRLLRGE